MTLKPLDTASRNTGHTPRHAAPPRRAEPAVYGAIVALIAVLAPFHSYPAVQILLVPLVLTVPGILLLRALRIPGEVVTSFPVYIPCASIVVLFGSGLAVDITGPLVGVAGPLPAGP